MEVADAAASCRSHVRKSVAGEFAKRVGTIVRAAALGAQVTVAETARSSRVASNQPNAIQRKVGIAGK